MNHYVPLSDRAKEIILGSLLGDGSLKIHDKYKNARFSFRHSEAQKDYFFWKVKNLKEISSKNCVFWQENNGGFSSNKKIRYQSLALPSLTEIYQLTHKKKKLRISRRWLNKMTALSLAIWWFDDGSLIANGRKGVFCTDGFDEKSVKTLAQYFLVVWKIKTKVAPITRKRRGEQKKYWRLWLYSTEELKKFLRLILPQTPTASALSKVALLYNDQQLQQRWISEIVQLSRFSLSAIMAEYEKKRAKWSRYR
ncbi:MAG: hypothetical protein HYV53_04485 [Parcubacteria group bacterium]|nr:hypothetical protein [Parcubacteria group bacterium]